MFVLTGLHAGTLSVDILDFRVRSGQNERLPIQLGGVARVAEIIAAHVRVCEMATGLRTQEGTEEEEHAAQRPRAGLLRAFQRSPPPALTRLRMSSMVHSIMPTARSKACASYPG